MLRDSQRKDFDEEGSILRHSSQLAMLLDAPTTGVALDAFTIALGDGNGGTEDSNY